MVVFTGRSVHVIQTSTAARHKSRTGSDNLAVEDTYKDVEDQYSDVEIFSAEDPDTSDSITEGTHSQGHCSVGDEERSAECSFTAKGLHKDIEMLRRRLPDSPQSARSQSARSRSRSVSG